MMLDMRIAVLGSGTNARALPPHLAELATPEATPVLVDPRLTAFALTPYERLVVDLGYVDAAQAAERDGFAAVFIHSFADYGIAAARAALKIPVVGAGEATLLAAAAGGRRFAIVTVWPASMAHLYDERLRMLGLLDQCAAIHHVSPEAELARVGLDDGVMARMQRRENDIVAKLLAACEGSVRDEGAECIVLGCTCMAPVGPAIAAECSVPVLESSRVGYHAAVAAAAAGRHGRSAVAADRRALVPSLVDAWLGAGSAGCGTAPRDGSDCPVCIIAPDPADAVTGSTSG
jgi:allantoin racemase